MLMNMGLHAEQCVAQSSADCSGMSADAQQFAAGLKDANKMMFCSKFDNNMRSQAMQMTQQKNGNGTMMTKDQAVEKVATMNNMMMPKNSKSSGGCPVK